MSKTKIRIVNALLVCCVAFMLIFMGIPAQGDESVTISPHKIILNAKCAGESQDIQAIIRKPLSDWRITDFVVSLLFGGTEIVQAHSLRYCVDDENLLASFDRQEIQSHPVVVALAGQGPVTFTVDGCVTTSDEVTTDFNGDDLVEILAPGKQK